MIECGYHSLWNLANFKGHPSDESKDKVWHEYKNSGEFYPIDAVKNLRSRVSWAGDVELEVTLYGSLLSIWSGGRLSFTPISEFSKMLESANQAGASYMLALNGGLIADESEEPGETEREALSKLVENNTKYGVRNKVTVAHDKIFQLVRDEFPKLDVIASCIRQLDPNSEGYRERFQKYDYVVPLNQHNTFEFLSQFAEFADKMILFLNHGCARSDLHHCYEHYVETERSVRDRSSEEEDIVLSPKDYAIPEEEYHESVPSQIDSLSCSGGELYRREDDLTKLLAMGVSKFKISRDLSLKEEELGILLKCIIQSRCVAA